MRAGACVSAETDLREEEEAALEAGVRGRCQRSFHVRAADQAQALRNSPLLCVQRKWISGCCGETWGD